MQKRIEKFRVKNFALRKEESALLIYELLIYGCWVSLLLTLWPDGYILASRIGSSITPKE